MKPQTQKIDVFLWFDGNAEEAVNFYVSVFNNAKILSVNRMPKGGPLPEGSVMSASFTLEGQTFHALNGGPQYSFTPAVSLMVNCSSQEEVDKLWSTLTADGGEEQPCGWLRDKFGLSWQIIPTVLGEMLSSPDKAAASRAMQAMLTMKRIDIGKLQAAYNQ